MIFSSTRCALDRAPLLLGGIGGWFNPVEAFAV